jgi:hypothetical protein
MERLTVIISPTSADLAWKGVVTRPAPVSQPPGNAGKSGGPLRVCMAESM